MSLRTRGAPALGGKGCCMAGQGCVTCRGNIPEEEVTWCSNECYYLYCLWLRKDRLLHRLTIDQFYQNSRAACLVCRVDLGRSPLPVEIKAYHCSTDCQNYFRNWFKFPPPKGQEELYTYFLRNDLVKRHG